MSPAGVTFTESCRPPSVPARLSTVSKRSSSFVFTAIGVTVIVGSRKNSVYRSSSSSRSDCSERRVARTSPTSGSVIEPSG